RRADTWVDPALQTSLVRRMDAEGWPRTDEWSPGARAALPERAARGVRPAIAGDIAGILARARADNAIGEADIVRLFRCRGDEFAAVGAAAGPVRDHTEGHVASHLVTPRH